MDTSILWFHIVTRFEKNIRSLGIVISWSLTGTVLGPLRRDTEANKPTLPVSEQHSDDFLLDSASLAAFRSSL